MKKIRAIAKGACVVAVALGSMVGLVTAAGAIHVTQNTVTGKHPLPTQTGCTISIEWGEFIFTAYASERLNSGCVADTVNVVYATGSYINSGPVRGTTTNGVWSESQVAYKTVFGAHWWVAFDTRSIGPQTATWTTNVFE